MSGGGERRGNRTIIVDTDEGTFIVKKCKIVGDAVKKVARAHPNARIWTIREGS